MRKVVCTAAIIVAVVLVFALVLLLPEPTTQPCCYCGKVVELREDPPLQNHWRNASEIICDKCFAAGRR